MKKENVISLFVFSLLFVGMFVGVASAVSPIFDPVKDMFSSWNEGDLSVNVAKYVFWIILTLFVFTILDFIPFDCQSL